MTDPTTTFNRLRPRLQGIAYRMLGSVAEAEDVVQDAWLRWHEADRDRHRQRRGLAGDHHHADRDRPAARRQGAARALRRLLAARAGADRWASTPEQTKELSDDVSVAFLFMLERLAPEARAAFLLREVFDADYDEVAKAIGKSEAACRQIVHRAKTQLREERPRFTVSRDAHHQLMRGFAEALSRGDFAAMNGMLAENAELIGDGGGIVPSFGKPLLGGQRIAQLFYAAHLRFGSGVRVELAMINGEWALLRFIDGVLESAQSYETDGERITRIHVQRNPEKLARLAAAFQGH